MSAALFFLQPVDHFSTFRDGRGSEFTHELVNRGLIPFGVMVLYLVQHLQVVGLEVLTQEADTHHRADAYMGGGDQQPRTKVKISGLSPPRSLLECAEGDLLRQREKRSISAWFLGA